MIGAITPCLWFAHDAEPAARHYAGVFANSAIGTISNYGENMPMPVGTPMLVEFTLRGQPFQTLNGGAPMAPSQAISLSVDCADQAELDQIWDGLLAGGGEPVQCGWLKDRFGVSWQIVPRMMGDLQRTGTPEQAGAGRSRPEQAGAGRSRPEQAGAGRPADASHDGHGQARNRYTASRL